MMLTQFAPPELVYTSVNMIVPGMEINLLKPCWEESHWKGVARA